MNQQIFGLLIILKKKIIVNVDNVHKMSFQQITKNECKYRQTQKILPFEWKKKHECLRKTWKASLLLADVNQLSVNIAHYIIKLMVVNASKNYILNDVFSLL